MKTLLITLLFSILWINVYSQNDTIPIQDTNTYRIIKTDGGELIGKILKQDAREILLLTNDNRQIYIPQHTIKEIVILNTSDFNEKGDFIGEDKFATRYFITTNGLPVKKGEHYLQLNLFGPDLQFGLGNNLGIGIMTTWVGMPIIGTIKKSWEINKNTQFAVGALVGTGSWAAFDWGGALPFGTISYGDRTKNIAISGGYGAIWEDGDMVGRGLTSIAGMIKISPKISLVFDSFILLPGKTETKTDIYQDYVYNPSTMQYEYQTVTNSYLVKRPALALVIPGIRWHQGEGKAIQFGFTGVISGNDFLPVPIPMIQWYRTF